MSWSDRQRHLAKASLDVGLCLNCWARMSAPSLFSASEGDKREEFLKHSGIIPIPRAQACPLCLGLLVGGKPLEIREECKLAVTKSGYTAGECEEWSISLSLPCSLVLRQAAFEVSYPDSVIPSQVVDVKKALRCALGWGEAKDNADGLLSIKINVSAPEAECEAAEILGLSIFTGPAQAHVRNGSGHGGFRRRQKHRRPGDLSMASVFRATSHLTPELRADLEESVRNWAIGAPAELSIGFTVVRHPIAVYGSYLKLSRKVPQTQWMMRGERKGEWSVEEIVSEPFEEFALLTCSNLVGAGREDMNVRMLGSGRPFYLVMTDCKKSPAEVAQNLKVLESRVNEHTGRNKNGSVRVVDLALATPADCTTIKDAAQGKTKTYVCIVWINQERSREDIVRALDLHSPFDVLQSTPVRVLHRRSQLVRPRTVHSMRTEWINSHFFQLSVETQAGTYIKEFVHGDLGRTTPSVADLLGCRADILQLDVEGVSVFSTS
jgi:tRNA pseudouridine synthase 10